MKAITMIEKNPSNGSYIIYGIHGRWVYFGYTKRKAMSLYRKLAKKTKV